MILRNIEIHNFVSFNDLIFVKNAKVILLNIKYRTY